MNGLLSLFLAGATLAGAAEDQAPKPLINVSAQIYMPDGKASGASRRVEIGTDPVVLYVYTGKTLCEARTVSTDKPMVSGNGWKVTIDAAKVIAPAGAQPTAAPKGTAARVTWQRLWEGGKEITNSPAKSNLVLLSPGNPIPLDTIDGAGRRSLKQSAEQLRQWKPGRPIPALAAKDGKVESFARAIEDTEIRINSLQPANTYQQQNPSPANRDNMIASLRADIRTMEVALAARMRELAANASQLEAAAPVPVTDGCAALSMNLQLEATVAPESAKVFELEFWLVHRDPSGKETTQRQVVRTRTPMGAQFYFDDVQIETERGRVVVEVYGDTGSPWTEPEGGSGVNIGVHRRYSTTATAFSWKTKEADEAFGSHFGVGEVLSYQLKPMPNDEGALVGHRFSLRVRVKVLQ